MGWTFMTAQHYTAAGKVDRKAECESLLNKKIYQVVKSAMVGATCYMAVKQLYAQQNGREVPIPTAQQPVFAVVVKTGSDAKNGYNFGYKMMDETVGPTDDNCPAGILNLLTAPQNQWAAEWRERCKKKQSAKNSPTSLSKLPVGTIISFKRMEYDSSTGRSEEVTVRCYKHPAAYQFKRPFWMIAGTTNYMSAKDIPLTFTVEKMGNA